jgi:hypothetical protein
MLDDVKAGQVWFQDNGFSGTLEGFILENDGVYWFAILTYDCSVWHTDSQKGMLKWLNQNNWQVGINTIQEELNH